MLHPNWNRIHKRKASLRSDRRSLHMEALEARWVLNAGSLIAEPMTEIAELAPVPFVSHVESIAAQMAVVEVAGLVQGKLYTEIPTLTPEQQAMLDGHRQGVLPEPVFQDGPVITSQVPETIAADPILGKSAEGGGGGGGGGGDFQYYRLESLDSSIPTGRSSNINEPSVGSTGRGVFQSGNWYASLSTDNGKNWQFVDPFSMFAGTTQWGGFCCDQRVAHDDARDMTLWYLQYIPTGTTANDTNGTKIAVARSEDDLLHNTWTYYDFTPASFGMGPGVWFDFPHMQVTDDFAYVTTNVFTTTTDAFVETLLYRLSLADLSAGGTVNVGFYRPNQTWSDAVAIATATGASDTMYAASLVDNTTIRVYDVADAGNSINSRTVSGLNTTFFGTHTSIAPDGNNWTGRADSRVQTGWVAGNTVGFMWNSAQGTDRPQPFVRAVTLDRSNLSSVTAQPDLWSGGDAWQYPAIATNGRGHIAGSVAFGGPSNFPRTHLLISDDFTSPPAPWTNFAPVAGAAAGQNRWGDYLAAQADDEFGNTWISTGFIQNGPADTDAVPYFFWYGRERDNPGPNLRGTEFDVVQEPRDAGNSFDVDFEIINDGADLAAASEVRFYVSTDDTINSSDAFLGSLGIGPLIRGANTGTLTTNLTLPSTGDPFWQGDGTYFIGMISDATGVVAEFDESDNSSEGEFIDFDGVQINNTVSSTPLTVDLGILPAGLLTPAGQPLAVNEVFFYQFELLEPIVGAEGDFLLIDTLGSTLTDQGNGANDTEIGLYDAAGNLLVSNDDFIPADPANRWSRLSFGADPLGAGSGDLGVGEYFLAIGGFDTTFNASGFDATSTSSSTGTVVVNFDQNVQPSNIGLGVLPAGLTTTANETLIPAEVFFFDFELFEPIVAAEGDFLSIDTLGSILDDVGSGPNDTEIGLYDAAGNLLAANDDFIPADPANRWSRLAFGADPLGASSGDLPAGGYSLAVGAFDTTFNGSGFDATSTSPASGSIVVRFEQQVEPTVIDLGILPLGPTTAAGETLIPREVFFYRFDLVDPILTAEGDYLLMDTLGSLLTDTGTGPNDTEIGLYDSAGNLIISNDDFLLPDRESRLAFGADPLGAGFGDLATGEYFLAVGAYNTQFGFVFFDATSDSSAVGSVVVNFEQHQSVSVDGDFNDDGQYNCLDIDALVAEIAAGTHASAFDLTQDGQVNLVDRDAWLAEAGGINLGPGKVYLLGDATLDGVVDVSDFSQWNTNKFTIIAAWCSGDFSADGVVDVSDFTIWNVNKFTASDAVAAWPGDRPILSQPRGLVFAERVSADDLLFAEPTERTNASVSEVIPWRGSYRHAQTDIAKLRRPSRDEGMDTLQLEIDVMTDVDAVFALWSA